MAKYAPASMQSTSCADGYRVMYRDNKSWETRRLAKNIVVESENRLWPDFVWSSEFRFSNSQNLNANRSIIHNTHNTRAFARSGRCYVGCVCS